LNSEADTDKIWPATEPQLKKIDLQLNHNSEVELKKCFNFSPLKLGCHNEMSIPNNLALENH
jgi:hypothetical protein